MCQKMATQLQLSHDTLRVCWQLIFLITFCKSFVVSSLFLLLQSPLSSRWLCTAKLPSFTLRAYFQWCFEFESYPLISVINVHPLSSRDPFDVRTMWVFFSSLTCPSLTSILFVFTCCYLRRVSCKDLWHCLVSLLFSLSLSPSHPPSDVSI